MAQKNYTTAAATLYGVASSFMADCSLQHNCVNYSNLEIDAATHSTIDVDASLHESIWLC